MKTRLPQLDGELFLTDGGIETVLIFHDGLDLPAFAAFDLLKDEAGTDALRRYYAPYLELARERGAASSRRARPGARARGGRRSSATAATSSKVQPQGDRAHGGAQGRLPRAA